MKVEQEDHSCHRCGLASIFQRPANASGTCIDQRCNDTTMILRDGVCDCECGRDTHGRLSSAPWFSEQDSPSKSTQIKWKWPDDRSTPQLWRLAFLSAMFRTMQSVCVVMLLTSSLLMQPSLAFNVDLKSAVIHEGPPGSMFGFAVAQHVDQSTNWLLVGAPTAETRQRNVTQGGAVYRCKPKKLDTCQQVPFDINGNNVKYTDKKYVPIEEKSHQWFGATIQSSGENGIIVACAPRYVYFSTLLDKREPIGACWVSTKLSTSFKKFTPCLSGVDRFTHADQYNRQGFCQAGFSASVASDGTRLMIGAPGSWHWQGKLYLYSADRNPLYVTKTGPPSDDNSYRGYSSAVGWFDSDTVDDYVVGVPRGNHLYGKVEMYSQNMTLIGNISGDQLGSYFGYAVAVTDLNADGSDDIIVGAPFYAKYTEDGNFDSGRVYIYYQTTNKGFLNHRSDILEQGGSKSRFGLALSKLDDINYDGYNDLCVGAPSAGEDGNGAIYIYHGSKRGIITDAAQVIYASDFKIPLSAFGASISGGLDQDGNEYPDMLVGAFETDTAVFLRTRPVVRVVALLQLTPSTIDLDKRSCMLQNGTSVTCLDVSTCIQYSGLGVPDDLLFDLTWDLDSGKKGNGTGKEKRVFYIRSQKSTYKETIKLHEKMKKCKPIQQEAYIKNDITDKLSPIIATMSFKLNKKSLKSRRKRGLTPILDAYVPTSTSVTQQPILHGYETRATILKDCGADNVCHPDLHVTYLEVQDDYIIGSSRELGAVIIVRNDGEDSFNTQLFIDLPPGVFYNKIENTHSEYPIICEAPEKDPSHVRCRLGNPMPKQSDIEFLLLLQPTNSNDTKDALVISLYANSSNPEKSNTYHNNGVDIRIPVKADTRINFFGKATPELIVLNTTGTLRRQGRILTHIFQINMDGPSATNETDLQVMWPSHDKQGTLILAFEGDIEITGNGKCKIIKVTPKSPQVYLSHERTKFKAIFETKKKDNPTESIACSENYCTIIQCNVGYMDSNSNFILKVRGRLLEKTVSKLSNNVPVYDIVSMANAQVKSIPYDFKSAVGKVYPVERLQLVTQIDTDSLKPKKQTIEIWIIAVAITAGLLLLLLLILLLCWCGFFKRKKPDDDGYFPVTANGKTDIDNKYVD